MSTWTTIRDDAEAPFEAALTFIEGSTLYTQFKADIEAAWAELESIAEEDLKAAVTKIGEAILSSLSSTDSVSAAIAAGIAAAPAALAAAGKDISTKTITTLVTSIVNSVAPTPAPVAA